jgi:hypothetical protein
MSYDLLVYVPSLPNGLRTSWPAAIGKTGVTVELHPDFDPDKQAGYLGWKLQVTNPDAFRFASLYAKTAVEAGFELNIQPAEVDLDDWQTASPSVLDRLESAEEVWTFSNPHGGRPADFRLLWSAAAALAELTDGVLQDPQEDRSYAGKEATEEAAFQSDKFEEEQRDDWAKSEPFTNW